MAAAWFYEDLGAEKGPFTALELRRFVREGEIGPGTLVRKEAGGRWVLASKVRGLLDEAVTESNGEVEQTPAAEAEERDPIGIWVAPVPVGSTRTDEEFAGAQEMIPPRLPVTSSRPNAVPGTGQKEFIRIVRAGTYYPYLRLLNKIMTCIFVATGGFLLIAPFVFWLLGEEGPPSTPLFVLCAAGICIAWLFFAYVFYESCSLIIDIADVLIEQARRAQRQ